MHVSLTPELEARVKAKVETGLYNDASEVIREALRFMETHEEWIREIKLARLREQLRLAWISLIAAKEWSSGQKALWMRFFRTSRDKLDTA